MVLLEQRGDGAPETVVITRHSIRNYGSVLQAYATKQLIERTGHRCRIVDYRQAGITDSARGYSGYGRTKGNLGGSLRALAYVAYRDGDARARGMLFEEFIRRRLEMTQCTYRSHVELEESSEFGPNSAFCVGSDQVWNIECNLDNRPYYLEFAPKGARRFSLASSLGLKKLPPDEEAALVRELEGFKGVSVRESGTAEYLARLGIEASVHLDPTLGLARSEWQHFARDEALNAPHVLVYQLNSNPDLERAARVIGKQVGLPVVRVEYWKNFRGRGTRTLVRPSVEKFVSLFRDTEFVVTDSFHGTAFALNFSKPFAVFRPAKYSNRIESILDLVGLRHRLADTSLAACDLARNDLSLGDASERLSRERVRLGAYLDEVHS